MSSNSRFAIAVHMLALMARAERPLSSSYIADSVNTNPVTIRKVLCSLNSAELITTQMGAEGGSTLAETPDNITLLDVYRATNQGALFAHHPKAPNPDCRCGQGITTVLDDVFDEAEHAMQQALAQRSIASIVTQLEDESAVPIRTVS